MFTVLQPTSSWARRYRAVALSVGLHVAVLLAIVLHNPALINVTPTWLAFGDSAHSTQLIYVPPGDVSTPPDAAKLLFPRQPNKSHIQAQSPKPLPKPPAALADAEPGDHTALAGSPLGTLIDGPITGHEVHVAYPVVYPDPPVARDELPRDLVGDVVIEVTIDSQGNVVETKIVQAIGHGIDEKIEATLRRWRYQPATLDGTPVASRHDVHFHFPS